MCGYIETISKLSVGALLLVETAAAGSAVLGMSNGSFLTGNVGLTDDQALGHFLWMGNAALAGAMCFRYNGAFAVAVFGMSACALVMAPASLAVFAAGFLACVVMPLTTGWDEQDQEEGVDVNDPLHLPNAHRYYASRRLEREALRSPWREAKDAQSDNRRVSRRVTDGRSEAHKVADVRRHRSPVALDGTPDTTARRPSEQKQPRFAAKTRDMVLRSQAKGSAAFAISGCAAEEMASWEEASPFPGLRPLGEMGRGQERRDDIASVTVLYPSRH